MKVESKKLELNSSTSSLVFALMGIGIATFLFGLMTNPSRIWFSFLLHHSLFMGLGIGGLFFMVVHYLAGAGWNVAMRRVSESFASYLIFAFLFSLVLLLGLGKIYPWTNPEFMEADHVLRGKIGYFGMAFFTARILAFFAVVLFFGYNLIQNSLSQDEEGGVDLSYRQKPLAAMFIVLFAPLFTVFAVDTLKSLDPKWFSTMFGVYVFIGFVQASVAATIITIRILQKHGYLSVVTEDHFHDLGKYLLGFSIFWAYIGVSQYLLIWYANLPEEVTFYMARERGSWLYISILLPLLRFLLPFLMLLPRMAKRTPDYLRFVSYIVLVGAWVDLFYLIMPTFSPEGFSLSILDVGMLLGFLGFFCFAVRGFLSRNNLVPVKDPYLHETLHHHVL